MLSEWPLIGHVTESNRIKVANKRVLVSIMYYVCMNLMCLPIQRALQILIPNKKSTSEKANEKY